jgi:hypothetical protein
MAEDPCARYPQCDGLDGQLLISRTADGPAIAVELGEMPFGPVVMKGASLHPYVRWTYRQTWSAKEACLGPARSVMGLAPGEKVTIAVTHRESVDATTLVREAAARSKTLSRTEGHPVQGPYANEGPRSGVRTEQQGEADEAQEAKRAAIMESFQKAAEARAELQAIHYSTLNSPFLEVIVGAIVGAVAGGAAQKAADAGAAIEAAAKQIEHEANGGPGTINYDTNRRIDEVIEEVERAESQTVMSETTTTTRMSTEQRIVRTFVNPYRDRTLELRFFPVFRRFEITTTLVSAEPGVLLRPGLVDFAVGNPKARLGSFIGAQLAPSFGAAALADHGEEDRLASDFRTSDLADHLDANAAFYTRRFVDYTGQAGNQDALLTPFATMVGAEPTASVGKRAKAGPSLGEGMAWSRAHVKNGEIHVPFAEPANWSESWNRVGQRLSDGLAATIDNPAWRTQWTTTRSAHVLMGTHVEAVAGTCILEDLPPE